VINALYLEKAAKKARGKVGDKVEVDKHYYNAALATLKKVSGAIKRDIEKKYGAGGENEV
jgi:protein tyrosine/serine phosphatase